MARMSLQEPISIMLHNSPTTPESTQSDSGPVSDSAARSSAPTEPAQTGPHVAGQRPLAGQLPFAGQRTSGEQTDLPQTDSPQTEQPHAEQPLVETPELLRDLSEASESLEKATPQEILRWAVDRYAPRFTMATAFGPEGMVLLHMLAEIAPRTPIFNLDTGYQFAETLELRERVLQRYGMAVELKRPATTVEEYERLHGGPLYKTNPNQCCFDRKLVVLRQAVEGMHAWASAIRRDQSPDRARAPIVAWDRKFQLVKISPLANWTKGQVWDLIVKNEIPYNPLHDQGYASIGCQPCTRAILFGEDERAGRWSGIAKTECGLHTLGGDDSSAASPDHPPTS